MNVETMRSTLAWLEEGGPGKAEVGDWAAEHGAVLLRHALALQGNVDELEMLFDLQYHAQCRAVERWNIAHPDRPLTIPDTADLVFWLIDQLGWTGETISCRWKDGAEVVMGVTHLLAEVQNRGRPDAFVMRAGGKEVTADSFGNLVSAVDVSASAAPPPAGAPAPTAGRSEGPSPGTPAG